MPKKEITLKNTKGEIYEALEEALKREKELSSMKSDPVKEEKKKKANDAIEESKKNVSDNIFSDELKEKFTKLELAISEEEAKLKELYGVENELNNLTLVTNTSKDFINQMDEKKKNLEEEYNNRSEQLSKEFEEKKKTLEKEYQEKLEEIKKTRTREEEEYNYKIKRDREIDNNKWLDEKKQREEALALKENELKEREKNIKDTEDHFKELEKENENTPALLDKEYKRGKEECSKELSKEYDYEKKLLSKDFQSQIDRQKDKIDSLTEEINLLREENKSMQDRLDSSYKEIKDMAAKTVEATGGLKILNNNQTKENI